MDTLLFFSGLQIHYLLFLNKNNVLILHMKTRIIFLWNNDKKQLYQLENTQFEVLPFNLSHNNDVYYAWIGLPGFYFSPATEASLLAMFSFYLQNKGSNKPEAISSTEIYNASYSESVEIEVSLEEYLHSSSGLISLNQDVVGMHPNFSYNYFFHRQLQYFVTKMSLENGSILEVGCGEAKHLLFLKKEFRSMDVQGIEPAKTGVNSGLKAALKWDLDIKIHMLYGEQQQLPENKFDIVFCHGIMLQSDINHQKIFENMLRMSSRLVLLVDCLPELWEPDTMRTMASLNYFQLKNYHFGFYNSLLRNDWNLKYKIIGAERLKHGWNPLAEPSLVIIEKLT